MVQCTLYMYSSSHAIVNLHTQPTCGSGEMGNVYGEVGPVALCYSAVEEADHRGGIWAENRVWTENEGGGAWVEYEGGGTQGVAWGVNEEGGPFLFCREYLASNSRSENQKVPLRN